MYEPMEYFVVVDEYRSEVIGLDNFIVAGEALRFERDEPGVLQLLWESNGGEKVSRDGNWACKAYGGSSEGTDS